MPGLLPAYPPRCPHCKNNTSYISRRKNLWDWLVFLLGGRPYRCRYCGKRFIAWLRNFHPLARFVYLLVWLVAIQAAVWLAEAKGWIQFP